MKDAAYIFLSVWTLGLFGCNSPADKQVDKPITVDSLPLINTQTNATTTTVCNHTNLSVQFDFTTSLTRFYVDEFHDFCVVEVAITNKLTKKTLQTIQYSSVDFFEVVLKRCDFVRSYQTHTNDTTLVVDNNYGDLVVADFNFDQKDDFAIIKNSGGNSGTEYNFYVQDNNRQFTLDKFLTSEMLFFPEIHSVNKTLVTYSHAGVCHAGEHIYQYNSKTNKWSETSHRIINICED